MKFLPKINTPGYHALLICVALFVLGPLGGVTAAFMNFKLGFFVGGQVLAGILGSAVTYAYHAEGKHGANYMQTMAASVASMSGMAVLIQAMVWMNLPMPPWWVLVLFFGAIGMFGVGVGMLYTPILVDRLKLQFPSGNAVANILRALTDPALLKSSIARLAGGTGAGILSALAVDKIAAVGATGLSASTIGAGMVVSSRIAIPGVIMGVAGLLARPALVEAGWLQPNEPFRKIGFLIALAMILGAALVDLTLIGFQAVARAKEASTEVAEDAWKAVRVNRLVAWVVVWGVAVLVIGSSILHQPIGFMLFAILLTLVFVLINGISQGISDSNPISSAFVISVLLMAAVGLKDPITGLMCASILLISCSIGVDMQQDRSTGWRLGTNRIVQFRYQVLGVTMGSFLCVGLAKVFMNTYPELMINSYANPEADVGGWQSAMTYKFVGALGDLGHLPAYKLKALGIGLAFGIITEIMRKLLHRNEAYKAFVGSGKAGFAFGWIMDSILLSSPYALSFGGFVDIESTLWFALGGCVTSLAHTFVKAPEPKEGEVALPEDMSTTSLVGGGFIAGESLFYLGLGLIDMVKTVL